MENVCQVEITGEVVTEPKKIMDYGIERIYEVTLRTKGHTCNDNDVILDYSVSCSQDVQVGAVIHATGELRTLKRRVKDHYSVKVYVFAKTVSLSDASDTTNHALVRGVLVQPPIMRKSFKDGVSDVTTMCLKAVRVREDKCSFIPVIMWNSLARLSAGIEVGKTVEVEGLVQSHKTHSGRLMTEVLARKVTIIDD